MSSTTQPVWDPKWMVWVGWIISILPVLMLIMSGVMKFMLPEDAVKMFEHLGWDVNLAFALGIVELSCALIYLIPGTAVLGAVLLTGYLGGAVATHVRVGDPFFQKAIIPIILGILVWGGLWLRDGRVRALMPVRS
jgi:uncharacterized membrane protein YphA (DoxX/SURF4 family)